MRGLLKRLSAGERLVADGAMGTLLLQRGLPAGQCPESINLSRPELLEEIARQYLDAGAEIIQTNTFGASLANLTTYGLEHQAQQIIQAAVQAVRAAVGNRAFVCGSCGPTGRLLKPHGEADPEALYSDFLKQATWLVEAGVDVICIETMSDLTEATLAVRAAKAAAPAVPVMATMTFNPTPRGFYTFMGTSVAQAAAGLQAAGADVVGSNCGNGIEPMIEIAREFKRCTRLPLIIQPNAGLPELQGGALVYRETPQFMSPKAADLLAGGVSIVGGCCGTTPEHIAAIRKTVHEKRE